MAAERRHRDPARASGADHTAELIVAPDAEFEPDRAALGALAAASTSLGEPEFDPDLTREFWGNDDGGRRARRRSAPATRSTDGTRAVRETRELRMSGRARAQTSRPPDPTTRRTGPVPRAWSDGRPPTPPDANTPPDELVVDRRRGTGGADRAARGDRSRLTGPSGLGAVDPLLRRLGAIVMVGVLAVPLALALRPSDGESGAGLRTIAAGERAEMLRLPEFARAATVTGVGPISTSAADHGAGAPTDAVSAAAPSDATSAPDSAVESAPVDDAQTAAAAPACTSEYTIAPGDYWLRLAEGAGVPLADLLRSNSATIETVIHPGDRICLPEGARTPPPPPTTTTVAAAPATSAGAGGGASAASQPTTPTSAAPSTTIAPRPSTPPSTVAPSTAPPATAPPATTAPATTAPATAAPVRPPSSSNPSADEVRAIIREVWPADQHEMAITVARRESNFRANAYNGWCCHGVFQIHWSAHRGWLSGLGVTSVEQLYDARTNIEIAHQIYQRAGGWGPWRQTAH